MKTGWKDKSGGGKLTTLYKEKREMLKFAAAAALSFGLVCAIPAMLPIKGEELKFTGSIVSFLLWLALFYLMNRVLKHSFSGRKRRWLIPGLFSLIVSVCMTFGAQLEQKESVAFTEPSLWLSILVLAVAGSLPVRYCWDRLSTEKKLSGEKKISGEEKEDEAPEEKRGLSDFLITAGLIFVCYLPVFLAVYPGFFVYDAQDELMQVITRSFSTHHPLLHVLLLGGIIQLVYKISGSYNLGIACYTLFQMAALSLIFAGCIESLKKEGMKFGKRVLLGLYFGLWPTIVMFSLCSAKDGLFTGMLLIMVMMLRKLCRTPEEFFQKKLHAALLGISSFFMMLLRHNGFYAFLVFAVVLLLFYRTKEFVKVRKKFLVLLAAVFVGYLLFNKGMTAAFHADASENQELLTVPIQQMARVYQMDGESLSEEDKAALYEILPKEALERYVPKVSDGVKVDFNNEAYSKNPGKYLKLWMKLGAEHPFTYLNAWFMTSYGFWYPDTVIDVYRGNSVFTFTYGDSSYFGYEVEEPGIRESRIPFLAEIYRRMSLEIFQQRIPVLSMLFSPGFLFYVFLFFTGFFWYSGDSARLMPYCLPGLLWLTVILGPTYLVRYVLFLWVLAPVLLWDFLHYRRRA